MIRRVRDVPTPTLFTVRFPPKNKMSDDTAPPCIEIVGVPFSRGPGSVDGGDFGVMISLREFDDSLFLFNDNVLEWNDPNKHVGEDRPSYVRTRARNSSIGRQGSQPDGAPASHFRAWTTKCAHDHRHVVRAHRQHRGHPELLHAHSVSVRVDDGANVHRHAHIRSEVWLRTRCAVHQPMDHCEFGKTLQLAIDAPSDVLFWGWCRNGPLSGYATRS